MKRGISTQVSISFAGFFFGLLAASLAVVGGVIRMNTDTDQFGFNYITFGIWALVITPAGVATLLSLMHFLKRSCLVTGAGICQIGFGILLAGANLIAISRSRPQANFMGSLILMLLGGIFFIISGVFLTIFSKH